MSFNVKPDRPIRNGLSQVVRHELDDAMKELRASKGSTGTKTTTAVHEARKSVKKTRAVLRLLRDALGADYRPHNRALRKASHSISRVRDVEVLTETAESLHGRYPTVLTSGPLRQILRRLHASQRAVRRELPRRAQAALRIVETARKSIPDKVRGVGHRSATSRGLVDGYRQARLALESLSIESPASEFHRWRRRTKDHWYHMRLFRKLSRTAAGRVKSLRRLERWLGSAHDLELLRLALLDAPRRFGKARATTLALGCIEKWQQSLNRRALKLGHRLFQKRPRQFEHVVADW